MSERRAHVVLRSIVGPALGLSVSTLVAAGSASGCASSNTTSTQPTPEPTTSSGELWVGTVSTADRVPEPQPTQSASATPTAAPSEIPKPGEIPAPGTIAPPTVKVGMMPAEDDGTWVGTMNSAGFRANGGVVVRPKHRPTRITRRVTDASPSLLRCGRASARPRTLV